MSSVPERTVGARRYSSGSGRSAAFIKAGWPALLHCFLWSRPLEVRKIVNDAVADGNVHILILLAAGHFGLGIAEGLLNLGMNVYRGWVSENAVRWLRTSIASLSRLPSDAQPAKATETEITMTLSEAEPIGNFVGSSVSEPFLQGGILIGVFAYMVYLQPLMALIAFGVFFPRLRRRLAKINDPWSDLVTWYRDFRMVNERYRLVSGALQTVPIPGNDASNVSELPRKWAKADHS